MSLDYRQEQEMIAALRLIGFRQDKLTGGFKRGVDCWVSWAQAEQMWLLHLEHLEGRAVERDQVKPESEAIARFVGGQK